MKTNKLKVQFGGLGEGFHSFQFEIDNRFFEQFENSEIAEGQIILNLNMEKRSRVITIEIQLSGRVMVMCDICLDTFALPIDFNGVLYLKYGETERIDDDVVVIHPNDYEIDLSQYVYESIHLSLPYKRVHPKDDEGNYTCNPLMIEKLNQYKIEEEINEEITDPRWDILKNLKNNN